MALLDFVFLAIIQGITEWLPISSSGHLVLAEQFFNLETPFYYNILIHFATVLVIFLVFYKDIWNILKAFVKLDFKDEYGKLGLYIILGTIPIVLIGFSLRDFLIPLFENVKVVGFGLLATAVLLFGTKYFKGKKNLTWVDSIVIGLSQAFAIIPGVSRSGSTISSGLILGISKEKITTFSFLLAVPAIIGALILEYEPGIITTEMIVGMLVTIIVGYATLKILINLILHDKFHYFGWYCLVLGIIALVL